MLTRKLLEIQKLFDDFHANLSISYVTEIFLNMFVNFYPKLMHLLIRESYRKFYWYHKYTLLLTWPCSKQKKLFGAKLKLNILILRNKKISFCVSFDEDRNSMKWTFWILLFWDLRLVSLLHILSIYYSIFIGAWQIADFFVWQINWNRV